MATSIPVVADNEIIATAWGNQVRTEVSNLDTNKLSKSGGTMTGDLSVNALIIVGGAGNGVALPTGEPSGPGRAARRDYVDAAIATAGNDRVAVTGDTMTGTLTVGSNPTSSAGVQLTAPGQILSGHGTTGPSLYLRRAGAADAVGGHYARFVISTSTIIGSISIASGSSVAYNETSDRRLKNDLGPIVDALERVGQLQPRHLAWKSDGTEFDGFIADEVQAVAPYAVTGQPDAVLPVDDPNPGGIDPQQLDTGKLIALLVGAVQELSAKVAALEGAG